MISINCVEPGELSDSEASLEDGEILSPNKMLSTTVINKYQRKIFSDESMEEGEILDEISSNFSLENDRNNDISLEDGEILSQNNNLPNTEKNKQNESFMDVDIEEGELIEDVPLNESLEEGEISHHHTTPKFEIVKQRLILKMKSQSNLSEKLVSEPPKNGPSINCNAVVLQRIDSENSNIISSSSDDCRTEEQNLSDIDECLERNYSPESGIFFKKMYDFYMQHTPMTDKQQNSQEQSEETQINNDKDQRTTLGPIFDEMLTEPLNIGCQSTQKIRYDNIRKSIENVQKLFFNMSPIKHLESSDATEKVEVLNCSIETMSDIVALMEVEAAQQSTQKENTQNDCSLGFDTQPPPRHKSPKRKRSCASPVKYMVNLREVPLRVCDLEEIATADKNLHEFHGVFFDHILLYGRLFPKRQKDENMKCTYSFDDGTGLVDVHYEHNSNKFKSK